MAKLTALVRTATTFATSGELDEHAFRQYLQRFVDANVGVYVGSGGSGEGHALTRDELRRVYRIAVETCKGKVPVNANPPEQHTAKLTIEHSLIAVEAGVEQVNVYGPTALHGYQPTDDEFRAYFDEVLPAIEHPVALAPNPIIGYTPRPELTAEICARHRHIVTVNLAGLTDDYFIALRELIGRDVAYNVPLSGAPNTFALGATGLIGGDFNIVPKTLRRYVDLHEAGRLAEMGEVYAELKRFVQHTRPWSSSTPRWIKMAMKVLKLPGGEGGLRAPYRMPAQDELQRFTDGLLRLRVTEIDELARAAGLGPTGGGA